MKVNVYSMIEADFVIIIFSFIYCILLHYLTSQKIQWRPDFLILASGLSLMLEKVQIFENGNVTAIGVCLHIPICLVYFFYISKRIIACFMYFMPFHTKLFLASIQYLQRRNRLSHKLVRKQKYSYYIYTYII